MQLHTEKKSRLNPMLFKITLTAIIAHIFLLSFQYIKMRKYFCEFKEKAENLSEDLQNMNDTLETLRFHVQDIKDRQQTMQAMLQAINSHAQVQDEKLDKLMGEKQLVTKLRKKKDDK